ncbi:2-dehydro-3-deoxy-6-phosphogalactonate aldolase [Rhizobium binxianense]|jgi:2-dehydro-3-deoxyphosphogalactonate aldolase
MSQTHPTHETNRKLTQALKTCPLVAVLRWITPEDVEGVTGVLVDAGFRLIEVPLNSPNPFLSIEKIAARFGDTALIGAGTVMSPESVVRVGSAGGRLIVMPHADVAVVRAASEHGFACFPGVATPTEGFAALAAGAAGLKIFPAEAISPPVLKAWRAVFAKEVPLMPTGGITPEAMALWVKVGASGFGIGGNLYRPGKSLDEIRSDAVSFVSAWHKAVEASA